MHTMKIIIVLVIATGCISRKGPSIAIVFDQPGLDQARIDNTIQGASAWQNLDVTYTADSNQKECPLDWYADAKSLPCTITIHVSFYPKSELSNAAGLTDRAARTTMLALELTDGALVSVAAHEVGHSLWNTGDHLAAGQVGIMMPASGGYEWPTDDDVTYVSNHADGW